VRAADADGMKRLAVSSTSVASVGYEPEKRELEIEFRDSGGVYLYFDVPPEEYAAFMAASSKGVHVARVFKPRGYPYVVVREGKPTQS
jgi:hypothetical protein